MTSRIVSEEDRYCTIAGTIATVLELPALPTSSSMSTLFANNMAFFNQFNLDTQLDKNTVAHLCLAKSNGFDPISALLDEVPYNESHDVNMNKSHCFKAIRERFECMHRAETNSINDTKQTLLSEYFARKGEVIENFVDLFCVSLEEVQHLLGENDEGYQSLKRQTLYLSHLRDCIDMFSLWDQMNRMLLWRDYLLSTRDKRSISIMNLLACINGALFNSVRTICTAQLNNLAGAVKLGIYNKKLLFPDYIVMSNIAATLQYLPLYMKPAGYGFTGHFNIASYVTSEHVDLHKRNELHIDPYTMRWLNTDGNVLVRIATS